jgi:hypothetical protein
MSMLAFLKNSLLYKACSLFFRIYEHSLINSFFRKLGKWYWESLTHKILYRYVHKDYTPENSVVFKAVTFAGKGLNFLRDNIHSLFRSPFENSGLLRLYKAFMDESNKQLHRIIAVSGLFFVAGYALTSLVKGQWSSHTLLMSAVILLPSLLLLVLGSRFKTWFYESCSYRWVKNIFE